MSGLVVTIIWILVISAVGMLPRAYHWRFGLPMLMLFPFVLGYLAWDTGIYWALALVAAWVSIYRYPLKYFGLAMMRKVTGRKADQ